MMRTNLLPRRGGSLSFFGLDLSFEYARQGLAGFLFAALVAGIGNGVERIRIANVEGEVAAAEARVAARSAEREAAQRLALDVARYEEFSREAAAQRRTGVAVALAIARLGNALPRTLWLDTIDRDAGGYGLAGGARTVDDVGRAIDSLEAVAPGARAELVALDARSANRPTSVHFSAHLATSGAAAVQP